MKVERSAGLVVFREAAGRREYLLVRSRRHGAWGFPKGHVQPGESEEAAARRETVEEAGLPDLDLVPGFRQVLCYPLPGGEACKEVVYLLAQVAEGRESAGTDDAEIAEVRWAGPDEALGLLSFENTRGLLRAAESFLADRP